MSQKLRAYLQACEQSIIESKGVLEPSSAEARWLGWAHSYADQLNPLKNGSLEVTVRQFIEDAES